MPENKDELLRRQQEEIRKLKKELKEASRPSSLFSTLKNSVKRNVREFFNREDKIKNMNAELKELRKKLAETEEEKARQDAIIFAAGHMGTDENEERPGTRYFSSPFLHAKKSIILLVSK